MQEQSPQKTFLPNKERRLVVSGGKWTAASKTSSNNLHQLQFIISIVDLTLTVSNNCVHITLLDTMAIDKNWTMNQNKY